MSAVADILPLEVIDRTVNSRVHIVLQNNRELVGILRGFDDFVNVILEDSIEYLVDDNFVAREVMTHNGRMLLSGNNITMLIPKN